MKNPKELPSEDQPDIEYDELIKKLGLMHISEAIQMDGELILLRDQTIKELRKACLAQVEKIAGKNAEEIESILIPIFREHAKRFEERAKAIMSDYS
jgi:hypothetical protein